MKFSWEGQEMMPSVSISTLTVHTSVRLREFVSVQSTHRLEGLVAPGSVHGSPCVRFFSHVQSNLRVTKPLFGSTSTLVFQTERSSQAMAT